MNCRAHGTLLIGVATALLLTAAGCETAPSMEEQRRLAEAACAANPACVAAQKKSTLTLQQQAEARANADVLAAQQKVAAEQRSKETVAEVEKAVENMRSLGFVTRMDGGARSIAGVKRIYVDRRLWDGFKVDQKEDLVKVLSAYRNARENLPQVTLYDDRSGHELASFGAFSGVQLQ